VLDLSGGQALLLTTPSGHALLIDGGAAPSLLAAALSAHLPFWRAHLDAVLLSDVDLAHVGGLRGLTARYTLDRALDPGAVYPAATYALWRAELRDAGVPESKLRTGARYRLDGACSLDVLLPGRLTPEAPAAPVALRLMLGRFSLLLLNRAALAAAPADLLADGARGATALVLPAGADDPSVYAALVRLLRPRLVVLPSTDDAREDPTADLVTLRTAHPSARASGRAATAPAWRSAPRERATGYRAANRGTGHQAAARPSPRGSAPPARTPSSRSMMAWA
jgi:beta-lactamase superfamily II metal-dependent hydrolase